MPMVILIMVMGGLLLWSEEKALDAEKAASVSLLELSCSARKDTAQHAQNTQQAQADCVGRD